MDGQTLTLTATEFKAKCLGILDRLAARELSAVSVTKRGRVVAVLTPPVDRGAEGRDIHGFLRDSVTFAPDYDPTESVASLDDFDAHRGVPHR